MVGLICSEDATSKEENSALNCFKSSQKLLLFYHTQSSQAELETVFLASEN